ncbi:ABC transporter ATP-binding protein [Georgenia sp. SYP-B2076]|uniref:dipeptide ABC transporter ATP-binding protein n=1 Tax=Georgenia sp. SYP-B2076 TaxID=2495881 RepID=UPI000F8C4438|nr:ABC transporter ATP-binding protein [Georgenia sp. SYP-B2076]
MSAGPSAAAATTAGEVTAALLTVTDLRVATGRRTLVEGVNLTMARGERVGLIGESGSGKSMTALALMGLLPEGVHAAGSVRLAGVAPDMVTGTDRELRAVRGKDMTMVFQEPLSALNPLMRVGTQVAEVMDIHRTAGGRAGSRARALELLAQVRLPDPARAARAYPHELSGGQRQRAMLAMALANDPALLVADEPTTALDVTVQRQVLDLALASVTERGTGLLFITHDLAVVANVCDRVLVMNDGRVVEEGATEEVFTRPRHPYTRGLLAASDLDATDSRGRLFTVASAAWYVPPRAHDGGARPAGPAATGPAATGPVATGPVATGPVATGPVATTLVPPAAREQPGPRPGVAPIVSVRDLLRTYRRGRPSLLGRSVEVEALRGVSFDVAPGQRLGVVGESGSGKSTLLRILAGLDQPTSGSVRVAGDEVAGATERDLTALRRSLQIVFQDPMGSLDPRMTVEQVVAEPLQTPGSAVGRREQATMVADMLAAVGLPRDSAERYPHQFSGGERQRISIARALVRRPQVLVADEPVSALDVSVRAQVLNLLADLVDEYQLSLVFVSHDLGVVRRLCDTVVVLHGGEIVESGRVEDVYERPRDPYTRTLVGSSMSLRAELAAREAARRAR